MFKTASSLLSPLESGSNFPPFLAVRLLSFCEAVRCHRGVSTLGGHGRGPKDQCSKMLSHKNCTLEI